MKKKIAVFSGDGIGQEIVPEAIKVLETIGTRFGHSFECKYAQVGGAAIDATGFPLPSDSLELAKKSDAVLLGAVGGPKWEGLEYERRPERALLGPSRATWTFCKSSACKDLFSFNRCVDSQTGSDRWD